MKVRRRALELGVFLVALGGTLVAAQAGWIDTETVRQLLPLWPVAVIAAGIALILRRTPFAIPGGVVAAALPGLLLGGVAVAMPTPGTPCGDLAQGTTTQQGTFGDSARVSLRLACGELTVTTVPGSDWRLDAATSSTGLPVVSATADSVSIASAARGSGFDGLKLGDRWTLALPTTPTIDLDARVDAGQGTFDLAGAHLGRLQLNVDAGQASLDLTGATLSRLVINANAAAVTVRLPAESDLFAEATVNVGSLKLCAPSGLGLRVHGRTAIGSATYNGLVHAGDAWETPGYSSAQYHADVTISAAIGSVDVNPQGGCK